MPSYGAHVVLAQFLNGMSYKKTIALPADTRGYEFTGAKAHLGVLWTTTGTQAVIVRGDKGARVVDIMGNSRPIGAGGKINLTTIPQYVISTAACTFEAVK